MDVLEAIFRRKSIRGYKPDPVPTDVLKQILAAAGRTPSALNSQPWEFVVVAGDALARIRDANIESLRSGASIRPDHFGAGWPIDSVYRERQVALAKQLFSLMDIGREDREKRAAWSERGFRFFGAPTAIFICVDNMLSETGPLLDIGAVMQTICLAAMAFGLGTCIEDQGVMYPEEVRQHAGIAENKRIIIAIAIGYPDEDFPANQIETDRLSVSQTTRWVGFSTNS